MILVTIFKIIGIISLLIIVLYIIIIIIALKAVFRECDIKDKIALNIDDINRVWKAGCPSFSSVTKYYSDLFIIKISNEEEKQIYQEWLSTLPINFPHKFIEKNDKGMPFLIRIDFSFVASSDFKFKAEEVIGGLHLMSEDEDYYGNFIFMEDGFYFVYDVSRIHIFRQEMEELGCPLPEFHVLSFAGCATHLGTDLSCDARVKFVSPLESAYYEKVKKYVPINECEKWNYQETEDGKFKIERDINASTCTRITFWKDKDGNSLADMHWASF